RGDGRLQGRMRRRQALDEGVIQAGGEAGAGVAAQRGEGGENGHGGPPVQAVARGCATVVARPRPGGSWRRRGARAGFPHLKGAVSSLCSVGSAKPWHDPVVSTKQGVSLKVSDSDERLLALLRENARCSTAELARRLGLSRTTVQSRIDRLEKQGVIRGY